MGEQVRCRWIRGSGGGGGGDIILSMNDNEIRPSVGGHGLGGGAAADDDDEREDRGRTFSIQLPPHNACWDQQQL